MIYKFSRVLILVIAIFSLSMTGIVTLGYTEPDYSWDFEDGEHSEIDVYDFDGNVYHYDDGDEEPLRYDNDTFKVVEGRPENSLVLTSDSSVRVSHTDNDNLESAEFSIYPEEDTFDYLEIRVGGNERPPATILSSFYLFYEGAGEGYTLYDSDWNEIYSIDVVSNDYPFRFVLDSFNYDRDIMDITYWDLGDEVTETLDMNSGCGEGIEYVEIRVQDYDDEEYASYWLDYIAFNTVDSAWNEGGDELGSFDIDDVYTGKEYTYNVDSNIYEMEGFNIDYIGHYNSYDDYVDENISFDDNYEVEYEYDATRTYLSFTILGTVGDYVDVLNLNMNISGENYQHELSVYSNEPMVRNLVHRTSVNEELYIDFSYEVFSYDEYADYDVIVDDGSDEYVVDMDGMFSYNFTESGSEVFTLYIGDVSYNINIYVMSQTGVMLSSEYSTLNVVESNVEIDYDYEIVSNGSDYEWVNRNIWSERVEWRIEPVGELGNDTVTQLTFDGSYFDEDLSNMTSKSLFNTDVFYELFRDDDSELMIVEDVDDVDYYVSSDSVTFTIFGDWDYINIEYNPTYFDKMFLIVEDALEYNTVYGVKDVR